MKGFEYRWRAPAAKPEERKGAPPKYRRAVESGMLIERDVAVTLRDGAVIHVDVFRPADEKPAAPVIAWGPYGKHGPTVYALAYPTCGLDQNALSKYTAFEAPDPAVWVPRGFAVINADTRGTWFSQGDATFLSPEEARDYYDLIEWAGTQPWSSGKVGLSGVSYLTSSQWRVAELNPPHLAAINPWEGWADTYREVARHGGIPETTFWPYIGPRWSVGTGRIEDLLAETKEHPLFDDFWASKAATFNGIKVPAYIVASWTDQGMHTRGTLEGFKRISSKQKWLEVHGRKKWAQYYEPACVQRQLEFFDHYLRGVANGVPNWPKVRLEVREKCYVGGMQDENEWPISRTNYEKLPLNPDQGEKTFRYDALTGRAEFEFPFDKRTDLIGHMKLTLWAEAEGADDMDLFVAVQKLDAKGKLVPFAFWAQFDDGPVALGWLRASHRELDPSRSTEYQPVLKHERELKLRPGEIVPLQIEIWPSGTRFEAGERLRLVIQGTDVQKYPKGTMCDRHEDTVNRGTHVLHAGGRFDSYLLVPVVPEKR